MKLILPLRIADQVEPHIAAIAPNCTVVHINEQGVPDGILADADAFLRWWTPGPIFRKVLSEAPQVRWVHTPSAGVDHLLVAPELAQSDIILTNSVGAHAAPIAEFVMMYILNHIKRAHELYGLHPADAWHFEDGRQLDELAGKVLLILGLGTIGQEIAIRAAAFGMRVMGSRRIPRSMPHFEVVVGADGWRALLPTADYVVVATPLTDATRGMFGASELAMMRPTGYLMNVSRGQVLDQSALIGALNQGQIAGAALDVTDPEPPTTDDPIWSAKNLWITPHVSYSSPRTPQRMVEIFLDNLRRYANGEPLRNIVDKQAGY